MFLLLIRYFDRSLPTIDWIWDRGGLVAINVSDREKFVLTYIFFLLSLIIYIHRYRDTLLSLMTPGHTQLYILAMCYDEPDFNGQ